MGYAGYVDQRERARALRSQAWTLAEIASELGVARSTASVWCRDVVFEPRPRNRGNAADRRRHPQHLAKLAEIERLRTESLARIGALSERDLLVAGVALYAGEGAKTGSSVLFTNTDERMFVLFLRFLRHFFPIDEARLRMRLYLHEGLDLDAATAHWSAITAIPVAQFGVPYRAVANPSRRAAKHPMGCPAVRYSCSTTLRTILALGDALLGSCLDFPG
jgi:transcriptional regulator with XRE-family HTH domain